MRRRKSSRRYTTSTMARATAKPVPRIDKAPTTDASQTISRSSLCVVEVHIASAPFCLLKTGTKIGSCDSRRKSPGPPIGVTPQLCRRISRRWLRGGERRWWRRIATHCDRRRGLLSLGRVNARQPCASCGDGPSWSQPLLLRAHWFAGVGCGLPEWAVPSVPHARAASWLHDQKNLRALRPRRPSRSP
jgi:hypothetical protein